MSNLDLLAAFNTKPPPLDFVFPGLLAGTVGALVAPGGTGKSMFALQLACAVACNNANTLGLEIEKEGKVLYLNLEDPVSALQHRLFALGSNFDSTTKEQLASALTIESKVGTHFDLFDESCFNKLISAAVGGRLVIVDTLSKAHSLDENCNRDMSKLLIRLDNLANQTNASVLYLHHTSKASALAGYGGSAHAARGASALTANARFCCNLQQIGEDEAQRYGRQNLVKYEIGKQNYGQIEQGKLYERKNEGILSPFTPKAKKTNNSRGCDSV